MAYVLRQDLRCSTDDNKVDTILCDSLLCVDLLIDRALTASKPQALTLVEHAQALALMDLIRE